MIEKIIEIYRILQVDSERRHWIFAYVVVPGLLTSYMVAGLSPVGPLSVLEDEISVAPIKTIDDRSGKIQDQEGFVLIADSSDLEFSIPWKRPTSKTRSLLFSIDSASYQSNLSRIAVSEKSITARLPLLGVSDPFVLVSIGGSADSILLPGKTLTADSLKLSPRSSMASALWGVLACMFGVGMSIGIANAPIAKPEKE